MGKDFGSFFSALITLIILSMFFTEDDDFYR